MIITNKNNFIHIPKTSGKYIEKILDINGKVIKKTNTHDGMRAINNKNKFFAIIRNPEDWYISYYNYNLFHNVQNNKNNFFYFVYNEDINKTTENIFKKSSNEMLEFGYGMQRPIKMPVFEILNKLDIGFLSLIVILMITKVDVISLKKENLDDVFDAILKNENLKILYFTSIYENKQSLLDFLECKKDIDKKINTSEKVDTELHTDVVKMIKHKDRYIYKIINEIK